MSNFSALSKDVFLKILEELDISSIFELSIINKRCNNLCNDDIFWMNTFQFEYIHYSEHYSKNNHDNWKEYYKFITHTDPNILLWKGVYENNLFYVMISKIRGADIHVNNDAPYHKSVELNHIEISKYLDTFNLGGIAFSYQSLYPSKFMEPYRLYPAALYYSDYYTKDEEKECKDIRYHSGRNGMSCKNT